MTFVWFFESYIPVVMANVVFLQLWDRADELHGAPAPPAGQPAAGWTSGETEEDRDGATSQEHHRATRR